MPEKLIVRSDTDLLLDILETLRFSGSVFFHSRLAAPWGMSLGHILSPRFHIATMGRCVVGTGEGDVVDVREMEVVMLPNGKEHWIADRPGRNLVNSELASRACELHNPMFQHGEITNGLICGLVQFDTDSTHPLLESLPQIMHFDGIEASTSLWLTITAIDAELRKGERALQPVVDRLAEVLFLQLLDRYISDTEHPSGFLAALRDRRIQQALLLLHREPAYAWSLQTLGERSGMSRATLGRHFQEIVGTTPMAYLNHWRVMKAHNLIKQTQQTLEQIAQQVGFGSARVLTKAFLRTYQYTPRELRRRKP